MDIEILFTQIHDAIIDWDEPFDKVMCLPWGGLAYPQADRRYTGVLINFWN